MPNANLLLRLATAGLALGCVVCAPASAQRREPQGIDGWGPLRFHMTLETARAAGAILGETTEHWDEEVGQMLTFNAMVDGTPTPVDVVFRGWHAPVKHIIIRSIAYKTTDKDGCVSQLESLAGKVRRNYRGFQEYPAERASGDGVFLRNIDMRFPDGSWIQVEVHYNSNEHERDGQQCEGNVFYFPAHGEAGFEY